MRYLLEGHKINAQNRGHISLELPISFVSDNRPSNEVSIKITNLIKTYNHKMFGVKFKLNFIIM
jgi:hypothetical protein